MKEDDILTICLEIIIGIVVLAFDVMLALAYAAFSIGCWIIGMGYDE